MEKKRLAKIASPAQGRPPGAVPSRHGTSGPYWTKVQYGLRRSSDRGGWIEQRASFVMRAALSTVRFRNEGAILLNNGGLYSPNYPDSLLDLAVRNNLDMPYKFDIQTFLWGLRLRTAALSGQRKNARGDRRSGSSAGPRPDHQVCRLIFHETNVRPINKKGRLRLHGVNINLLAKQRRKNSGRLISDNVQKSFGGFFSITSNLSSKVCDCSAFTIGLTIRSN